MASAESLTCKFKVKATKRYSVRLENTERERTVHVEQVLSNATELHVNFIVVVLVNQLEVLDTTLRHTSLEIQHVTTHLVVPGRTLCGGGGERGDGDGVWGCVGRGCVWDGRAGSW